jgi:hypothetical protein
MPPRLPKAQARSTKNKGRQALSTAAVFLPLAIALTGTQLSRNSREAVVTRSTVQTPQPAVSTGALFRTGCGLLPFQDIAATHWLDDHCGIEGIASSDPANRQQNKLKNNFCLHSDPVLITPADLVAFQADVDARQVKYGTAKTVPIDRTAFRNLRSIHGHPVGEGTLVTLVGYIVDAHYADVGAGEGVNCRQKGPERNDIHFSISDHFVGLKPEPKAKRLQLCQLVTGEISPHYRPASWEVAYLDELEHIPVRLRGQLFFDASHKPCQPGKTIFPARKSVWELHPIYAIDVCQNPTRCRAGAEADWLPLDKWVHDNEPDQMDEAEE